MKRVLVADDDPVSRGLIRDALGSLSYEVIEASNGEEALRKMREARPDLILLDIEMPRLDGYEVLRRMRADPVVWIVSALEGACVCEGLSKVGAAFYSFGIPRDSVMRMEAALKTDRFLVIMHGTASEVGDARKILITAGVAQVLEYLAGTDEYDDVA